MSQTTKVFVGSLPPQCKPEELRRLFTNYGIVVECDVMNRCGFVHMETLDMAEVAIAALNGTEFKGNTIVVEPGRPKDRKSVGPGNSSLSRGDGNGNRGRARGVGVPQSHSRRVPVGQGGGNYLNNRCGGNFSGNRGKSFVNNNSGVGPIRSQGHKQQRNAPYQTPRGASGNLGNSDRSTHNINSNAGSAQYLGASRVVGAGGNFNSDQNEQFGSHSSNQFQSWDNNEGNSNSIGNRSQAKQNYSGGFSGNMNIQENEFYSGAAKSRAGPQNGPRSSLSSQRGSLLNQRGSFSNHRGSVQNQRGALQSQRGSSSNQRGPALNQRGQSSNPRFSSFNQRGQRGSHSGSGNLGQDRRGFTLPVAEQQQLQFGSLNNQSRFGNGPPVNGNDDIGRIQRGNNLQSNMSSPLANRGLLSGNRGAFVNRGGFSARRGGSNIDQGTTQSNPNPRKTYQSEFPPLGASRGGGNRNVSRQNMMPNRRF